MIVLVLVAILWIAVLVPSVLAKLAERRSAGSIGRFHQRLDLLERTGPKLVRPAYRLTGTESASRSGPPLVVPMSPPPVRPNLTLVANTADASELDDTGGAMVEEEMVALHLAPMPEEAAESWEAPDPDRATLAARERRRRARRRRRDVFGALCALAAVTGLMGLAHPLRPAWVVTGIVLVVLVAFVGLAVYGQHLESERLHLARLTRSERASDEGEEPASVIRYLSEDELALYHDALSDCYGEEDGRLAAQG